MSNAFRMKNSVRKGKSLVIMLTKLMTNCRATEAGSVSGEILIAYRRAAINGDSHLENIMEAIEKQTKALTTAIDRDRAKSALKEKNAARHNHWRSLSYQLLGAVHHPATEVQSAGEKVYHVFEKYGLALMRKSYSTQTTLIRSFLMDLSEPDMQQPIELISGCTERLALLEAAQEEFEDSRLKLQTARGRERKLVSATRLKQEVVSMINKQLVVHLRAMQQVDDATYGNFALTVAKMIAGTNLQVKRRRKKTEKA